MILSIDYCISEKTKQKTFSSWWSYSSIIALAKKIYIKKNLLVMTILFADYCISVFRLLESPLLTFPYDL